MWRIRFSSPSATPAARVRPSLTLFAWLVGAFLLTLVPHVTQLPVWTSVVILIAMVIRVALELYRLPLPSTTFCGILALCLLAGILLQFQTLFGRDAGTAFTAGLLALKFYEIRGPRDIALIIFSCTFFVMSALLYSQAIELFIYCLIMMWVLTALLLRTQIGDLSEDRLLRMLGRSSYIFMQALPLAIVLFFFFPRYTGKLAFAPDTGALGLTDTIRPGDISRLANNDDEAMRVQFLSGTVPSADTMYWRALVLWKYNRGTWTPGPPNSLAAVPLPSLPEAADSRDVIDQRIYVFAHYHPWLFALDTPISLPENTAEGLDWAMMMRGDVLQARSRSVDHKERYDVLSSLRLAPHAPNAEELRFACPLPVPYQHAEPVDPRVKVLADKLRRENPDTEAYILAVLHYFRQEHFIYTDSPGMLNSPDELATFLFETKRGYCEHYASAFAVLMRLAGHPARVIAGYHGATYNPYGNFFVVRQSNAHAWDEVWNEKTQLWERWDPTSAITSNDTPLANQGSNPGNQPVESQLNQHSLLANAYVPDWVRRSATELELRYQELESNWDDWVFSYDPDAQNRLAEALGMGKQALPELGIISLAGFVMSALVLARYMSQRPKLSPIESLYARFCRLMAQRGVPRSRWEGPLAYTERVAAVFPDKQEAIHHIGEIMARSRYGPEPPGPETEERLQSLFLAINEAPAPVSSAP